MSQNHLLRSLFRAYPFSKGRYRLMKALEKRLNKKEEIISGLYGRYQFSLDLEDQDLQSSFYFFMPERYEHETQRCIAQLLQPGMLALDIGAHIGLFSLLMADRVKSDGRIFSFEPAPNNFFRLKQNIELNALPQVLPLPMAVSNVTGKALLKLHEQSTGHSLRQCSDLPEATVENCVEIETIKLDDFIESHKIPHIDLIKIDAEGSEALILAGAEQTLRRNLVSAIICEIHSSHNKSTVGEDRVRHILYSHGYRSYAINTRLSGKNYLSELKPDEPVTGLQNLLFKK